MKRITASFKIFVDDDCSEDEAYAIVHTAIDDMLRQDDVKEVELDDYNPSELEKE